MTKPSSQKSKKTVLPSESKTASVPRSQAVSGSDNKPSFKRGTANADASEAYMRGCAHFDIFTEESFAKALVSFDEAITLDPNYALAHVGIADCYVWLGVYGVLPPHECFIAAVEAAMRASKIDGDLSEAHAALGFAVLCGDYRWAQSEQHSLRALELDPHNAPAHVWYSLQLIAERRFDEGVEHALRGVELDSSALFNQYHLAWSLYQARRFDAAIAEYHKLIAAHPLYPIAHYGLSVVLRCIGNYNEALSAIKRGRELAPKSLHMLGSYAQTCAAAGMRHEAETVLQKFDSLSEKRYISPYQAALIYNLLGEYENSVHSLEQAFEEREASLVWLGVEPSFDNLQNDSRFVRLLKRTGNPFFTFSETSRSDLRIVDDEEVHGKNNELLEPNSAKLAAHQKAKNRYILVIAVILLTAAGAMFGYWYGKPQPTAKIENLNKAFVRIAPTPIAVKNVSLAILPLSTVDAKNDDEQSLGVGTADLVTSKLSDIREINLRSASSVRRYLNTDKSPVEAGRELSVDYVVNGTIGRVAGGGNISANLTLTNVATGALIWTESFEQPSNHLYALQEIISEKIIGSLNLQLTKTEQQNLTKRPTNNNDAFQLYLAGRYHFGKRTVEGLRQAINLFQQSIELDDKFALAYAGLADCYALLNWYQESPPPDAWENAKKNALQAVQLDPTLAESHASLAFVKFYYERDFAGAEKEFKQAINLKPNYATAHQWLAFLLSANGQHDQALAEIRRAEELEPRSAVISSAVANVLFDARRYDEAIAQASRALELEPGSVATHAVLRLSYEQKNMTNEALAVYEKERVLAGDTPTTRAKFAHVLAAAGRPDEARRVLSELLNSSQAEHVAPYEIAVICALLNDKDAAFAYLQKSRDSHSVGFSLIRVDPLLDNLRDDPRFAELLK